MRTKRRFRNYLAGVRPLADDLGFRRIQRFSSYTTKTPISLTPQEVFQAYGIPQGLKPKRSVTMSILSLGGSFNASDWQVACSSWGIPAPTVNVISVDGATPISDPGGANVENQLDIQVKAALWSWCFGTPAVINVYLAPNNATGMPDAVNRAVADGMEEMSISWGGPLSVWATDPASLNAMMGACSNAAAAGCTISCASGDNSIDDGTNSPTVDIPCGSPDVWASGGTQLILNTNGTIFQESAWGDGKPGDPGGGGGFASGIPMPTYQKGIVPGTLRGCPDGSSNADPASGYQIYADGSPLSVGGTSSSAPFYGAMFAVIKALTGVKFGHPHGLLYAARTSAFRDIVLGSNGDPATVGWDEATGLGSPIWSGILAALSGSTSAPPPVTPPTQPPPGPTQGQIDAAINALPTFGDTRKSGIAYVRRPDVLQAVARVYGATVPAIVEG